MGISTQRCRACNAPLTAQPLDTYTQCGTCGSCNYLSDKTAEEENRAAFNRIFSDGCVPAPSRLKSLLLKRYAKQDRKNRSTEYMRFHEVCQSVNRHLQPGVRLLEVGFGAGEHLLALLRQGVDAYGVDLSENAVSAFREKYPKHRDRVRVGTSLREPVDVVYCCALLEHLDRPDGFLEDARACLPAGGVLILDGLPVMNERPSAFTMDHDICFWKPCHRIVYSRSGLERLLREHQFDLMDHGVLDDYSYRVMSLHLSVGYPAMEQIRNPVCGQGALPGVFRFQQMCRKALGVHSLARFGVFIFQRAGADSRENSHGATRRHPDQLCAD